MQDAHNALVPEAPAVHPPPALPLRSETILGVCEGLGEDFGFNPIYLRLVFAGLFYWNPAAVVGTYLALGLALALARWRYPVPRPAAAPQLAAETQRQPAANQADPAAVPLAA